jgi:hypothetical protein
MLRREGRRGAKAGYVYYEEEPGRRSAPFAGLYDLRNSSGGFATLDAIRALLLILDFSLR